MDVSEDNIPVTYPGLTAATQFPLFFCCFPRPETYYDNKQIASIYKIMIFKIFVE